jgi:hypothetical protein
MMALTHFSDSGPFVHHLAGWVDEVHSWRREIGAKVCLFGIPPDPP